MKKHKTIIISAIVLVFIVIGTGIWWHQHQENINFCKAKCIYGPQANAWKISLLSLGGARIIDGRVWRSKYFPTQEQCIDFCLIVK